jgi:hypothetical protein
MAVTTPRRARRPRSVVSTLAAMLLATELLVVLLAALALLGLKDLPPVIALGGGGALVVLIAAAAALATKPVGVVLGWVVQVVLVATFVVSVPVGAVGVVFAAIWVYAMIVGRRIDRREAPPAS